jgi:hypothetical protein
MDLAGAYRYGAIAEQAAIPDTVNWAADSRLEARPCRSPCRRLDGVAAYLQSRTGSYRYPHDDLAGAVALYQHSRVCHLTPVGVFPERAPSPVVEPSCLHTAAAGYFHPHALHAPVSEIEPSAGWQRLPVVSALVPAVTPSTQPSAPPGAVFLEIIGMIVLYGVTITAIVAVRWAARAIRGPQNKNPSAELQSLSRCRPGTGRIIHR